MDISWKEMQKDADQINKDLAVIRDIIYNESDAIKTLPKDSPMIQKFKRHIARAKIIRKELIIIQNEMKEYAMNKFLDR